MPDNPYCKALGIAVPSVEAVKDHREANTYALLLVALLERGAPATLREVAERFEQAGVAAMEDALRSLQRCRPARPPVYRDGDCYALDPHDDQLDLWAFRLGLRPPKARKPKPAPPPPSEPIRGPDEPLTIAELDEAWHDAGLHGWSTHRLAVAVLDAHGEPMSPQAVAAFVELRTEYSPIYPRVAQGWNRSHAVQLDANGRWALTPGHEAVAKARKAVRARIAKLRSSTSQQRATAADLERAIEESQRRRDAHASELAKLRRVLLHVFPPEAPEAAVLVDVAERKLDYCRGTELQTLGARVLDYDIIGAVDVRAVLRTLDIDPGERRLAELGPPQKTITINRSGRTLRLTNTLLCQGSCGISRPFGEPKKLRAYLRDHQETRLRRRLEADAKSLYALYEYGRLHGCVRLRWGFLDELIPAPWVHGDELKLWGLKRQAFDHHLPLRIVEGSAPGWEDPWARARICLVGRDAHDTLHLVDETGAVIPDDDVQLAQLLVETVH